MTGLIVSEVMRLGTEKSRIGFEDDPRVGRYLKVDGRPAYELSYACGTCGLVLRRESEEAPDGLAAEEVRDRLNAGLDGLDPEVMAAFSARLPLGEYLVVLQDVEPRLVRPGSDEDYFTVEGPATWDGGTEIDEANVPYYRLGRPRRVDERIEFFQFAVPLTAELDAETVARYAGSGEGSPTAVAFGLLEIQGPWNRAAEHWGLFHYLLDGHHKMAAGGGTRLLTFVSVEESYAHRDPVMRLPEIL